MRIVIVGGSLAGLRSLQVLRELGYDREIVVVGEETHLPYDRTTLSKTVLKEDRFPALLREETRAKLDARWLLGIRAVALRPEPLEVVLDTGEVLAAEGVVIATGARPRTLPALPGGLVLRRLEDCARLRSALDGGPRRLTVIGGGLVGAEVAATAAEAGHPVTIVEADPVMFARQFGPLLARRLRQLHQENGVRLVTEAVTAAGAEDGIVFASGERLAHDVLVVGVGAVPNVEWLASSGLDLHDGVVTDAHGITSHDRVVAAGDVARYASSRYGSIRVEHWTNARDMPAVVAAALLGRPGEPYDPVPYFWSNQYGHQVQVAGRLGEGELRFVEGGPDEERFTAVQLLDGAPVAAIGWDSPKAFGRLRRDLGRPG